MGGTPTWTSCLQGWVGEKQDLSVTICCREEIVRDSCFIPNNPQAAYTRSILSSTDVSHVMVVIPWSKGDGNSKIIDRHCKVGVFMCRSHRLFLDLLYVRAGVLQCECLWWLLEMASFLFPKLRKGVFPLNTRLQYPRVHTKMHTRISLKAVLLDGKKRPCKNLKVQSVTQM